MYTSFIVNHRIAKQLVVEAACFFNWLLQTATYVKHSGDKAQRGDIYVHVNYDQVNAIFPFWTAGKLKKLIEELKEVEAVTVQNESATSVDIKVNDTLLTPQGVKEKKKAVSFADPREVKKYLVRDRETGEEKELTANAIIANIIEDIKQINPNANKFYKWKVEREAILTMLDQGYEPTRMLQLSGVIPMTYGKEFAPLITSLQEFATKYTKLASYVEQYVSNKVKEANKFGF